jgi:hypothetical protein
MQAWRIEGFRGDRPTGLSFRVTAGENQIRTLLERLCAHHLTEDEVIDATFGSRNDFEITKNSGALKYGLMTVGSDYHYAASIEDSDVDRT